MTDVKSFLTLSSGRFVRLGKRKIERFAQDCTSGNDLYYKSFSVYQLLIV
jgi:hypothetical protein